MTVGERLRKEGEVRLNSPIEVMRFTLIYDGPLPSQGKQEARVEEKHTIRRVLHGQLRELWETRAPLKGFLDWWKQQPPDTRRWFEDNTGTQPMIILPPRPSSSQTLIRSFECAPFTFVPLVTERHHLLCELDILFLRGEPAGKLFATNHAGDLDNRIKVLFDALRIPGSTHELPKDERPGPSEEPMFCLLENDNLITAVRVESERLLNVEPGSSRVRLVIRVTVNASVLTLTNIGVVGGG